MTSKFGFKDSNSEAIYSCGYAQGVISGLKMYEKSQNDMGNFRISLAETLEVAQASFGTRPLIDNHTQPTVPLEDIGSKPHTPLMSDSVTREILDSKLELIESKLDAKVQRIEDKMDGFLAASKETQDSIKSLKTTIIVTAVSTVLAIVLGVAAFNSTVLSNMVASFESGKNTAQAIDKAQTDLQKREARLDEIDKKLDKLIAAPQPNSSQPQK
ncbi:hypothetical protein [Chromobacterium haemolyticum]|uniref:hypothetical protein n=1 Tax=Chromobacterium haemolyticum TaxID=394935 RepID=UPI0024472D69|nr:hypothetical protein [Chromobacterium haemolyticum]MDH0342859.1 hypothetical protein [Chromobacterium haemolyticum]